MAERPDRQAKKRFQFTPATLILMTIFSLGIYLLPQSISIAESVKIPREILVGEKKLSTGELIKDLVDAAFSSAVFLWDDEVKYRVFTNLSAEITTQNKAEFSPSKTVRNYMPWFEPYRHRTPESLPIPGVVNKWQGDITVGFDWPSFSEKNKSKSEWGFAPNQASNFQEENKAMEINALVELQVKKLIPAIQSATGRKVTYIDPRNPIERGAGHAKIRIVPIKETILKNFFKTSFVKPSVFIHGESLEMIESGLWGAVPFTVQARAQVEGYFIPNSKNEIELAVCKIMPDVGKEMFQSLITECLARSLGLPEWIRGSGEASIDRWNTAHERHSKTVILDGRDAYQNFAENKPLEFSESYNEKSKMPFEFHAKDKALISLLYCPSVKAGMNKFQVLTALGIDSGCFKKID